MNNKKIIEFPVNKKDIQELGTKHIETLSLIMAIVGLNSHLKSLNLILRNR